MSRVLVTGAQGFIGTHLVNLLHTRGYQVRAGVRDTAASRNWPIDTEIVSYDPGSAENDYDKLLVNVDTVVHLAGIAHRYNVEEADYFRINSRGSCTLARESVLRGVTRFIFLSSVKVHGESSSTISGPVLALNENSPFLAVDAYSRSKFAKFAMAVRCNS
jgi:nucleoside-diphosphate-sugar epimerase